MMDEAHLVRVTTDDRMHRLWAAATAREDAVDRVLDAIPEGWTARLLDEPLLVKPETLNMGAADVRELCARVARDAVPGARSVDGIVLATSK